MIVRLAILVLSLCASWSAVACPLCLGAFQPSKAEELTDAGRAVLAVSEAGGYRVVDVIKGERSRGATIDASSMRLKAPPDPRAGPLLLVYDEDWQAWVAIGAFRREHARWLRQIAAGKSHAAMSADEWRARVALMLPYLEHADLQVAEIAYAELAAAPYGALLSLKPRLTATSIRRWLADPMLARRRPLYLLLLGIAGDANDAERLERDLARAWNARDATNVGPMLAADLQLRGPGRMAWVEEHYIADGRRPAREVEAALLALSVHGNANATIPRDRVIASYRFFMKSHPDSAGYVAHDLAAWKHWEAVPDYVALLESGVKQQYRSRAAIVAYLRQSPAGYAGNIENPAR